MRTPLAGSAPGFTLIELVIVLAIVGAMVALAIPRLNAFQTSEAAKAGAMRVAAALREGRVRAMKDGIPYLVILNPQAAPPPGYPPLEAGTLLTVARIVRDDDTSLTESGGDPILSIVNFNVERDPNVRWYTPGTDPWDAVTEPPPVPAPAGTLGAVQGGSSFPLSPNGSPAAPETMVVFNGRGLPVDWNNPGILGLSGGVYVTDGSRVYGAVMGPLGEVRVLAMGPAGWN